MEEGPTKVKSVYHCATLVGNWEEERRDFGRAPESVSCSDPISDKTTYNTSFKNLDADQIASAKQPQFYCDDAPRELMFYHGDFPVPPKYMLSLDELSYTDRKKLAYTHEETLDMTGVSSRRSKTNALRRSMGLAGKGGDEEEDGRQSAATLKESRFIRSLKGSAVGSSEDTMSASREGGYCPPSLPPIGRVNARNSLLSTKQVTIDATGEYLYEHLKPYPLTSSVCVGKFMASKNDPMHKTKLRIEYVNS